MSFDRVTRRSILRMGAASTLWLGFGGALVGRRVRAETAPSPAGRARACILLYMEGGPSQLDTWDPKPGRETGGPFKAIETSVSGIRISEHLPLMAARAQRLAIIRTLSFKEGNHTRARRLMHTGYVPQGGASPPSLGALVAESHGTQDLPGYISIVGPGESAGLLGAAWSPFPIPDPAKPVRFMERPGDIDTARFGSRVDLRQAFDDDFVRGHGDPIATGEKAVEKQAVDMMRSPRLAAFRAEEEPEKIRQAYGDSPFGRGCLLARRLVEAGVPFVEVTQRGWDTHKNNFPQVQTLSADLDRAMSALLDDLAARGLLDSTLVVWMGDFGRTPTINHDGGRDHYPHAGNVVLAGAGLRTGQVIGETDADGREIRSRPIAVTDLFQTLAFSLGLDANAVHESPQGRPIRVVDGGEVIRELV
jgi:hypothetical protein